MTVVYSWLAFSFSFFFFFKSGLSPSRLPPCMLMLLEVHEVENAVLESSVDGR